MCTISTGGTVDSSLRNVTYLIARNILLTTIGILINEKGLGCHE